MVVIKCGRHVKPRSSAESHRFRRREERIGRLPALRRYVIYFGMRYTFPFAITVRMK